jgi:hypothetical protein
MGVIGRCWRESEGIEIEEDRMGVGYRVVGGGRSWMDDN